MPVIATPIPGQISTGQPTCAVQLAVAPAVTVVEGKPVLAKMQSVRIVQGQQATITWTMRDQQGSQVDLTSCSDATVQLKLIESLGLSSLSNPSETVQGLISNASSGLVQATLPADQFEFPGITLGEFGVLGTGGNLIFSNTFYLVVDRGQFAANWSMNGPPTLAEIRLHLRDSDPNGNLWLGDLEFDMAEVAACIVRPIFQFNEAPPPITMKFNTATFPYRHNWLNAICGYLYRMAADWYRRVHLQYAGQGVTIDDKLKFQQYDQRGMELLEDWKKWVQWKKVELNANEAYQSFGSSYSSYGQY